MTASTTNMGAPDPGTGWVPLNACTLPTADRPLRVAEFDDLFATALRAVHPHPSAPQARLVLAGDDTLPKRVQQLADAETSCCSFFTFTVIELQDKASHAPSASTRLALDIGVPPAHADVLHALVARAAARVPA